MRLCICGGAGKDMVLICGYTEAHTFPCCVCVSCSKSAVKAKMGTDVERKMEDALSNKNWGASSTLLNEIAQLTYD